MSVLVACSPQRHTLDGIHLGGLLARSRGDRLVAVVVLEEPWELRLTGGADETERRRLVAHAAETARVELGALPSDQEVQVDVRFSRSISEGLLTAIAEHDAEVIVLGSATDGALGRVSLGSVTQRLMHSSPVPVAVAPRGFTAGPDQRVARLSVAFAVIRGEESLVAGAARQAVAMQVPIRLVSFGVHQRPPVTTSLGPRAEDPVLQAWAESIEQHRLELTRVLEELPDPPSLSDPAVGFGTSWATAVGSVPWQDAELLVVGSSRTTPSWLVFLGDTASKISRDSPVPVVLIPRRQR